MFWLSREWFNYDVSKQVVETIGEKVKIGINIWREIYWYWTLVYRWIRVTGGTGRNDWEDKIKRIISAEEGC